MASCVNEESGSPQKFLTCLQEIFEEFAAGLDEVAEQHAARLDLCALTGGGIYDPDLDEEEFVEGVKHDYFPFLEGATWVYQKLTSEGLEVVTVTVTGDTLDIDDIESIAVRDVVTLILKPFRGEDDREVEITLTDEPLMIPTLSFGDDASEMQLAIREAWLTSVE